MIEKTPKVSVLMPIYHTKERYLRDAIESILNQTFKDFEFLILNDSPDNASLKLIVESYQDARIHYYENDKNIGITPSRNKLIALAKGEYLAIMDHDDISMPERFAEEVQTLDGNSFLGVVGCFYSKMGQKYTVEYPIDNIDIVKGLIAGGCYILHPASMIRKSVLSNLNLCYEEEFSPAEDYALWCRLIGKTKFYNIPKNLFCYREHSENASLKQAERMRDASHKIYAFVRKNNPYLWHEVKNNTRRFIKICGIPVIKVKSKGNLTKYYLFGFIPLLSVQKRMIYNDYK